VLGAIGNKPVNENSLLTVGMTASDADGDTITYSVSGLPSGATFAGQTFNWTPTYSQAGNYTVTFIASDGSGQDSETITITANNVNRAPVLGAIGNKPVNENSLLTIGVTASDADGDTITYSVSGLPSGATFASQTFNWTPSYQQANTYQVTFIASDGSEQDSETITITVNNVNRAPVLGAIGNKSVYMGNNLTFAVSANDPDGDAVTYSVEGLPSGAVFANQSFSWTPSYQQANTYQVTFIASDGQAQDSKTVTITVNNVNQPPVLAAIGSKSVSENSALSFSVSATDADGDTIAYSAQNLPTGASFSSQTFSWTPGYEQAGTYQVTFIASDGSGQDSETITITANNVNRAPVLGAVGNKSVNENSLLTVGVTASDADGDTITYSVNGLPSGATFASQTFNWTPSYQQANTYQVTFIASDGSEQDSETITITVNNVNRAPVLGAIGNKSVYMGNNLTFAVSANDPDGDTLTYSVNGLPSSATFVSQTFAWIPVNSQVGNHQVIFAASDGSLEDSETITIAVLNTDTSAPVVTNCLPAADAVQLPLNGLITLHIADAGKGVDANSVVIKVSNNVVYSGDTAVYSSAYGDCYRSGTKADYMFVCQTNEMFGFEQTIAVAVSAADLAGNVMSQHSYSFTTEMQSFGQNKKVGSGSDTLMKGAPATVRGGSGNIWAVWHKGLADSRDIYVGKLAAGADDFGSSIQLTKSSSDQCNPAIAVGSDDKIYVVWQDNRRGNWDIYISTSMDGVSWSAERIVTDSNNNQVNPAIAIDKLSTNRAHIVWQDDRNGNQDIYIATSSNSFLTATISPITSNSSGQIEPVIAVDSSNTVYVVWSDARGGSRDIYGAASNYGPWTNVPIVNNANNQSSPAIAVESEGTILHILWVDDRSGNQDIYYAMSDGLPSSPLSGSNIIDDTSGAAQSAPAIVASGSNRDGLKVFACWQDRRNVSSNGGDTDIYLAELTYGTGTNVLVDDDGTNADQSEPAMGIDKCGHPYLVWTDGRNAKTEIYYAGSTFVEAVALETQNVSGTSRTVVGTDPANISSVDDISVIVPAGAYPCDIKIVISKIRNPHAFTMQCLGGYDIGPSGIPLSQPVTVTIPYTPSGSGNSASAYWYNSLTGAISQQGISNVQNIVISPTLHALQFETTHFTPFYLLFAGGKTTTGGGGGGRIGGGCSMSAGSEGDIVEFLLPYVGLAVVMLVLKLRDKRNQKVHGIA
jgi:PKD repeat protein